MCWRGEATNRNDVGLLGQAVSHTGDSAGDVSSVTVAILVDAISSEVGAPLCPSGELLVSDEHATADWKERECDGKGRARLWS
jgi:hypothetical protein